MKEMICINCPMGCHLTVDDSDKVTSPKRMVTGSVKVAGGDIPMCSVKTVEAIPKGLIFDCLDALKNVTLAAPIAIGDVVVANVCDCGVDVIATKNIAKK